jgi:hypothetical protein
MTRGLGVAALDGAKAGCGHIQQFMYSNYLSGQRLKVHSDKLRGGWSIQAVPTSGDEVDAALTTMTVHAPVQEYGSHKTDVPVREHQRRLLLRNTTRAERKQFPRRIKHVDKIGRVHRRWRPGPEGAEMTVTVRAHTRDNNIPAHFFLRDAVRTQAAEALRIVAAVIRRRLAAQ